MFQLPYQYVSDVTKLNPKKKRKPYKIIKRTTNITHSKTSDIFNQNNHLYIYRTKWRNKNNLAVLERIQKSNCKHSCLQQRMHTKSAGMIIALFFSVQLCGAILSTLQHSCNCCMAGHKYVCERTF